MPPGVPRASARYFRSDRSACRRTAIHIPCVRWFRQRFRSSSDTPMCLNRHARCHSRYTNAVSVSSDQPSTASNRRNRNRSNPSVLFNSLKNSSMAQP